MRRFVLSAAFVVATVSGAAASDGLSAAMNLGQLVGNAEHCGASINTDAMIEYMDQRGLLTADLTATFENAKTVTQFNDQTDATCAAAIATARKAGLLAD